MIVSTFQTRDGDWIACAESDRFGSYVRADSERGAAIDAIGNVRLAESIAESGVVVRGLRSKVEAGSVVTSGASKWARWRKA